MAEVAALKDELAKGEDEQRAADKALHDALSVIPNMPLDEVPVGKDEHDNKEVRQVGKPPKLGWANKPKEHYEIGEALGLMDFETAAKLSGSRFVVLKGAAGAPGARARRSSCSTCTRTESRRTPRSCRRILVRDEAMYGTAQLPKFRRGSVCDREDGAFEEVLCKIMEADVELTERPRRYGDSTDAEPLAQVEQTCRESGPIYKSQLTRYDLQVQAYLVEKKAELWLIPTAEVPLTNLVREKIRDEAELPIRVTAYSPASAPRPARRARIRAA